MSMPIQRTGALNSLNAYQNAAAAPTAASGILSGSTSPSQIISSAASTVSSSNPSQSQSSAAASTSSQSTGLSSGNTGTSSSDTTQSLAGTDTFLKLLVAQLQNQDPTSPMDDSTFITQLAQFNSVEQMISLKAAVTQEANSVQASESVALIGQQVTYSSTPVGGGTSVSNQGTVTGVQILTSGVDLVIGGQNVPLNDVTAVGGATAAAGTASSAQTGDAGSTAGASSSGTTGSGVATDSNAASAANGVGMPSAGGQ